MMSTAPKVPTRTQAGFSYKASSHDSFSSKDVASAHHVESWPDDGTTPNTTHSVGSRVPTPLDFEAALNVSDTGASDMMHRAFTFDTRIKISCVAKNTQLDSMVCAARLEGPGRFYTHTWKQ
jgi:hypothetical protein